MHVNDIAQNEKVLLLIYDDKNHRKNTIKY